MDGLGAIMDPQLDELNHKIDALSEQMSILTEQAREAQLAREARQDLIETSMPIARRVMDLATVELEDVKEYIEAADLIRLIKKLISHTPHIEMLIDQLDGLTDLVEVVTPITKDIVNKTTETMAVMEQKGVFGFTRGGMRMMDNIVTHFDEEDVNRLGDNIVLILNTIKDMTQPEIMNFVRNTLLIAEEEVQKPVDISMFSLMKQMRDPSVRRGLALTMRVLHVVGEQAAPNGNQDKNGI
jgi:uncharacterized protein YjgD (DUF1641 family)